MNREDICFLMVQTRHLIEFAGNKDRFRVANFYADWVVHPAIDRSPVCHEMLRDLTRELSKNFSDTRPDFGAEVSSIIGFPKLRSELIDLFASNGLPTAIFEYLANWRAFVEFLLWFLWDQPIHFPDKTNRKANEIRDQALDLPRPHDILVEALAVVDLEGVPCWSLAISGDKKIKIMGRIEIGEPDGAFREPPT